MERNNNSNAAQPQQTPLGVVSRYVCILSFFLNWKKNRSFKIFEFDFEN